MPFGEIHHVDVVAHPGAVDGWVIVTKDREAVAPADGDLGQKRHQICWDAPGSSPECRTQGADGAGNSAAGSCSSGLGSLQILEDSPR